MADLIDVQDIVTDIVARIEQIQEELINNTKGQKDAMITAAEKVVECYNEYIAQVKEYNAEAQKYARIYREVARNNKEGALSDAGVQKARQTALSQFQKLNLQAIKSILIKLHEAIHSLQSIINSLAGVEIGMVYVINSQGSRIVVDITDLDLEEIVNLDRAALSKGGALKLRYNDSAIRNLITAMDNTEKQQRIIQSQVTDSLNAFFDELTRRLEISKSRNNNMIMWQLNGEWYKAQISAFGDVEETYVNVFLNYMNTSKLPNFLQYSNVDQQIDSFVREWVSQVDATPGGLLEDIRIGDTGKFFGVKSAGASLAGITPFVRLSQNILKAIGKTKNRGVFTKSQISSLQKSFMKKGSADRTKITKMTVEEIEAKVKELDEIIQKANRS